MKSVEDEILGSGDVKLTTSTRAKFYMVKKMDDVGISFSQGYRASTGPDYQLSAIRRCAGK
jgi:hypothetical protein